MTDGAPNARAAGLLIYTGVLFGATFPLGKIAMAAGVAPMVWAMVISVGALSLLAPGLVARGDWRLPRGRMLRYVLISGLVSFALINVMILFLIPLIGAGQVGLMFALSPVFTLALSAVAGLRVPGPLGLLGIALGLFGASVVTLGKGGGFAGAQIWALIGLGMPLVLAIGNVYRTLDWPEGTHPATLAFWSHGAALIGLIGAQALLFGAVPLRPLGEVPLIVLVQLIAAALTFPAYFRLQRAGGPLMLSQIGYVAAAVSLGSATLVLGERYGLATWAGAAIIAIGIALTVLAQSSVSLPGRPGRAAAGGPAAR